MTLTRWRPTAARVRPLLAVAGGATIIVGACLPWMSYFAGLVPLRGIIGLNGRLLLVVGLAAVLLALRSLWVGGRLPRATRLITAGLGVATVAAALWLLVGVTQLLHPGRIHPMFIAQRGPGLFVVLAGGAVLALSAIPVAALGHPSAATEVLESRRKLLGNTVR